MMKDKKCKWCKESFTPRKALQSYCGYTCSNGAANNRRKKEVIMTCLCCKSLFTKRPSDLKLYKSAAKNKYRFCSMKCYNLQTQSNMTITRLKTRAWIEFSKYIRDRDNWTCITCGKHEKGQQMHAGHFVSRRHNGTLFYEKNVHAQCSACNMFRNGEPHIYAASIISRYGIDEFDRIIRLSREPKKFTRQDLIDIYERYRNINKECKNSQ